MTRLSKKERVVRLVVALAALVFDLVVWAGSTQTWNGGQAPPWLIVALAVAAYACLVVWRSPVPGYLALLLLSTGGLVVPDAQVFAGYLVALFQMAWLTPRRSAVAALIGSVVPITVNLVSITQVLPESDAAFLALNAVLWSTLLLATWLAGRTLARSQRRLVTQREWAEDAQIEALAAERLRISREIHDTVAHSLTGIVLLAAGARTGLSRDVASKEELDEALGGIQSAAEQSMRELHRLLGMLRESDGVERKAAGVEQLGELVDSARAAGLDVVFETSGEPATLDTSIAHTVYRVVQEGLSNAMKHAGSGARVEVVLDWLPANLAITVRNTEGLAPSHAPSGGFGLIGLRERVSVSGGTLESSRTTDGYLLHAHLPISRPRAMSPEES